MIKKEKAIKICLLITDFLLMYVALYFALLLRSKSLDFRDSAYAFSILYVLWLPFIYASDFYDLHYFKNKSFLYNLIIFGFIALFLGLGYFYLRPQLLFTPKTILILNVFIFACLLYGFRKIFYKIFSKNKKEKVVILGNPKNIQKIKKQIEEKNFEILPHFTTETDFIVFTNDFYSNKTITILPNIRYVNYNEFYEILSKKVCLDNFSEVLFLEKLSQNNNKIYFALKRILDLCLGFLFFLVNIILFPFIALAIKIDSKGSIFYKQKRVGIRGNVFTVYKFRTMKEIENQNKVWRANQDNQITKVGKFLRRFHLDELPQSLSIIKGDISFVGPRPEWIEIDKIYKKEIPFYNYRYLEKPGFTGWAQINFKPSDSVDEAKEKFEYDLYYMKNKSIILDVEIVLKTLRLLIHKH